MPSPGALSWPALAGDSPRAEDKQAMAQARSSPATQGWISEARGQEVGAWSFPAKAWACGSGGGGHEGAGIPNVYGRACISLCENTEKLLEGGQAPSIKQKATLPLSGASTHRPPPDGRRAGQQRSGRQDRTSEAQRHPTTHAFHQGVLSSTCITIHAFEMQPSTDRPTAWYRCAVRAQQGEVSPE